MVAFLVKDFVSTKMEVIYFTGFSNIGAKVFQNLPTEDILKCRLICHSWKSILDDPIFWLKKLKTKGFKNFQIWLKIIQKSSQFNVNQENVTPCLRNLFTTASRYHEKNPFTESNFFDMDIPPLFITFLPEHPDLQIMKLIAILDKDFTRPLFVPPKFAFFNQDRLQLVPRRTKFPLHEAISFNFNIEIIKFISSNMVDPMKNVDKFKRTPLHTAVRIGNAEAVKYLTGLVEDINILDGDLATPLDLALKYHLYYRQIEIIENLLYCHKSTITLESFLNGWNLALGMVYKNENNEHAKEVIRLLASKHDDLKVLDEEAGNIITCPNIPKSRFDKFPAEFTSHIFKDIFGNI